MAGGVLASQGIGNLYAYVLIGAAGLVTGDGLYFFVGYAGGERVLRWRVFSRRRFARALQEAESRYRREGWWAVFAVRFVPYLRGVIYLAAGLSRMTPSRFFLAIVLSALIYAAGLCLFGYLFSENWHLLHGHVRAGLLVAALAAVAVVFVTWVAWKRRPRSVKKVAGVPGASTAKGAVPESREETKGGDREDRQKSGA